MYSTTALVISLDFVDGNFPARAMVHGVTEVELTLFTVGGANVLTLTVLILVIVITLLVEVTAAKIFYGIALS